MMLSSNSGIVTYTVTGDCLMTSVARNQIGL
jgi:hypothetical protein